MQLWLDSFRRDAKRGIKDTSQRQQAKSRVCGIITEISLHGAVNSAVDYRQNRLCSMSSSYRQPWRESGFYNLFISPIFSLAYSSLKEK